MARLLLVLVVVATASLWLVAAETEVDTEKVQDTSSNSTEVEEGRIRKHHLFSPFYGGLLGLGGLGGLGGLHSLAVLYAIKIKILIVAAIVGLSVYYYAKVGKNYGGYETVIPYEAYSPHGPIGYSSHSEIFAEHGPPVEYPASYPGPDPYSAWSSGPPHHDHHEFTSSSHHASAPGFDEHSGGEYLDRSGVSPSGQSDISSPATGTVAGGSAGFRKKRQIDTGILEDINWGEIAFQFLGVDTMGCRKRFVCELDFRSVRNPFTRIITAFIGKKFFDTYRDLSPDSPKPTHFEDCAKIYRECAAAAEYNGPESADDNTATEDEETTEAVATENNDESNDDEMPNDDSSNDIARMINRGRLILLRADQ